MKKLGFGTMRLELSNSDTKEVNMPLFIQLVDYFMENGYNYFDTAYTYLNGNSERALEEALVDRYPRNSYLIADKLPIFNLDNSNQMEEIFNTQLERMGVDYFDYYMLHNVSSKHKLKFTDIDSFGFIADKKRQGLIKHIGISCHDGPEFLEDIICNHPEIEFVQLQINYLDWKDNIIQSHNCYEIAKKYNLDVIVMEPLKGGMLAKTDSYVSKLFDDYAHVKPVEYALGFCRDLENVKVVLSGMNNMDDLRENINIFENKSKLSKEDLIFLEKVSDVIYNYNLVECTGCNYCLDNCPMHINISKYLNLYNSQKISKNHSLAMYYRNMITEYSSGPEDCIGCDNCSQYCPQNINISKYMKELTNLFQ